MRLKFCVPAQGSSASELQRLGVLSHSWMLPGAPVVLANFWMRGACVTKEFSIFEFSWILNFLIFTNLTLNIKDLLKGGQDPEMTTQRCALCTFRKNLCVLLSSEMHILGHPCLEHVTDVVQSCVCSSAASASCKGVFIFNFGGLIPLRCTKIRTGM